eukprot:gene6532-7274_t
MDIIVDWLEGLPRVFVTVACSSAWTDIPDVRFGTNHIDPGGCGTDRRHKDPFEALCEFGKDSTPLTFSFQDGQHVISEWNGALVQRTLYLELPHTSLPSGIKEGFVALLDHAEDVLKATKLFMCIPKSITSRAEVLRAFMFMGFQIVNPDGMDCIDRKTDYIFMQYEFN